MGKSEGDQIINPDAMSNGSIPLSPHAEASKLLEAALQQMDGIIAGEKRV